MNRHMHTRRFFVLALALAAALTGAVLASGPELLVIAGARVVPVSGPIVENGTIVVRGGVIEAVGTGVAVPPGARLIDGKGLSVYPGLIDLGNAGGLDVPQPAEPRNPRTRMEVERWKRQMILRPQVEAADHVKADAAELTRLAWAGVTAILAVPPGSVVRGQSSLLNVAAADDEPQIGNVADERRGLYVLRTPVALHVEFAERAPGAAYPESLMGVIGFVRQAFSDAQYYQSQWAYYEKKKGPRPVYDAALEAMQPALAGKIPVAFQADSDVQMLRALAFAREFKLDPIIVGAREADRLVDDLKAQKARVVYSLNLPTRPRTLAPDADENLTTLRERANAPKVPAALARAGVPFAFTSAGLRDPKDFVRNAAKIVKAGLGADEVLKALTLDAASLVGMADRLGSIEKGKIANLVVTEGDLFDEKMTIKQVIVDGRLLAPEAPAPAAARPGRPGQ